MINTTNTFKTPVWVQKFKADKRNDFTPYKVITNSGPALRFKNLDDAMTCYHKTQGRCLVSYNTEKIQYFIAYKFK